MYESNVETSKHYDTSLEQLRDLVDQFEAPYHQSSLNFDIANAYLDSGQPEKGMFLLRLSEEYAPGDRYRLLEKSGIV